MRAETKEHCLVQPQLDHVYQVIQFHAALHMVTNDSAMSTDVRITYKFY